MSAPIDATAPQPGAVTGPDGSSHSQVRRAVTAVMVTFALNGFAFAGWAARLPTVRDELDLRPEQLGLLLIVGAAGALVAMPLSGLAVQRLGTRRTILTFAAINALGLLVAAAGVGLGEVWFVAAALVAFGMGTGVWDAAMNIEGAAVEQSLGRAIMPRFHAGFSLGTMLGAAVGALAAHLDAPLLESTDSLFDRNDFRVLIRESDHQAFALGSQLGDRLFRCGEPRGPVVASH